MVRIGIFFFLLSEGRCESIYEVSRTIGSMICEKSFCGDVVDDLYMVYKVLRRVEFHGVKVSNFFLESSDIWFE